MKTPPKTSHPIKFFEITNETRASMHRTGIRILRDGERFLVVITFNQHPPLVVLLPEELSGFFHQDPATGFWILKPSEGSL